MTILLPLILLVIFAACVGFLYTEGMWSNAIRFVNIVTAGLLAMSFFEPAAAWLTEMNETMHHYVLLWDYLMMWALFALFLLVFREITDRISRVNVRFLKIVDQVGGGVFAALIGWVVVCFTLATFHTAPLAKNFMFEAFQPGQSMMLIAQPDGQWLNFTHWVSDGTFCRSTPAPFDPDRSFMTRHSERRSNIEQYVKKWGRITITKETLAQGAIPVRPPEPK